MRLGHFAELCIKGPVIALPTEPYLTDVLLVAAMPAREGLGEDLGPLSLATALVPARILQRATISSRGRCWSGTFEPTRINRGGSDDGTGARAYSHWPAEPATERRFNACP